MTGVYAGLSIKQEVKREFGAHGCRGTFEVYEKNRKKLKTGGEGGDLHGAVSNMDAWLRRINELFVKMLFFTFLLN